MGKSLYPKILTGLLLIGISMACRIQFTRIPQPETETSVSTPGPKETETSIPTASLSETKTLVPTAYPSETATPVPALTEFFARATATPKFAPFCEPNPARVVTPTQCQIPIAEQSSVFCSSKVPYNLILINEGSTYETLNEDIKCSYAGRKDSKQMLTCTGPMALSFELKVCDPACAIPTFQAGITHCPQDYNYNDFLRCCELKPHPIDSNCVVLKLQTKSCVIDCSEFIEEATCNKNAYACVWDYENKVCLLRK